MDSVQQDPSRPQRRTMSIQERIKAMNLTLEEEENRLAGGGDGENFALPPKMRVSPPPSKHQDSLTSEETAELTDDEVVPKRASVVEMWRRREASKSKTNSQASVTPKESPSPATTPNVFGKATINNTASLPSHQVVDAAPSSEEDKRTAIYTFEEKKDQNLEDEAEWTNFDENDRVGSHPIVSSGPVDLTLLRPNTIHKSEPHEDLRPTSLAVSTKPDNEGGSFEESTPSRKRTSVVDIWKKRETPTSSGDGVGGNALAAYVTPTHNESSSGGKRLPTLASPAMGHTSVNTSNPRRLFDGQGVAAEYEGHRTELHESGEAVKSIMASDTHSPSDKARSVKDTSSNRNLRSKVRSRWKQQAPAEQATSFEDPSPGLKQPYTSNTLDKPPSSFVDHPSPKGRVVERCNERGIGDETTDPQVTAVQSTEESNNIKQATVENQFPPSPFNNVRASWERRGSERQLTESGNSSTNSNVGGQATSTPRNSVGQRWSPSSKGQTSLIAGAKPNNSTHTIEAFTGQPSQGTPQRSSQTGIVNRWSKRTGAFASGSLTRDEATRPAVVAGSDSQGSDNSSKQSAQPTYPSAIPHSKKKPSIKMVPKLAVAVTPANAGSGDTVPTEGEDGGTHKPSSKMSYGFQRRNKQNLEGQQDYQGRTQNGVDEPGQIETKAAPNPAGSVTSRKIVDKKQYLLARHRQRVKAARTTESNATDEESEDSSALEQAFLDTVPSDEQNKLSQDLLLGKQKTPRTSGIVVTPSVPLEKQMGCGQKENGHTGHGSSEDPAGPLSAITQSEYASLCVSDSDSFVLSGLSQTNPWSPNAAGGGDANSEAGQSDARSFVSGTGSAFTGVSASSNTSKQAASPLAVRAGRVLRDKRLRRTSAESQNGNVQSRVEETPKIGHQTNPPQGSPKLQPQNQDPALLNVNFTDPSISGNQGISLQSPSAFDATSSMQSPSAFGPTTKRNFSFGSETTGASSQMLSTSASETETKASSHRTDLSSSMKSPGYRGKSLQTLESAEEMVADEFVSESNSNVQAFQSAYQALSLEQLANDLKEEVAGSMINVQNLDFQNLDFQNLDFQNLDFTKLASDLNEGMSAASESLNKLVGGVSGSEGRKGKLRVPDRGGSPIEEGVAIEVEYIEDSDEEDGPQKD